MREGFAFVAAAILMSASWSAAQTPKPKRVNKAIEFEIAVDADHFVVVLNGEKVLDAHDGAHASGVVGFQCQRDHRIEFRSVKLLPRP